MLTNDESYNIKIPVFEGPFDLLLYLIKKNELDIYDISISLILEEYLKYLDVLKTYNLSSIGEFILIASQLIYIKSQMLLPNENIANIELQNENDPRKDLVAQLIEHQKYKEIANKIDTMPQLDRDVFKRGINYENEFNITKLDREVVLDLTTLANCFYDLMEAYNIKKDLTIKDTNFDIREAIANLTKILKEKKQIYFKELIELESSIIYVVVMFLAVLELTKRHNIIISQEKLFENLIISKN